MISKHIQSVFKGTGDEDEESYMRNTMETLLDYVGCKIENIADGFDVLDMGWLDTKKIKPDLYGGKWLGERCVDSNQEKKWRQELDALWLSMAVPHKVKMMLGDGDTQTNESLHNLQTKICRKDIAIGNGIRYVWAMAAGVCKFSVGNSFVIKLADKLNIYLPKSAHDKLLKKNEISMKHFVRCSLPSAKTKRKIATRSRTVRLHPNEQQIDSTVIAKDYKGKGRGDGGVANCKVL